MCWNARTSFVTLGIGTCANVAAYFILRNDLVARRFVMAWQYALLMQVPEGIAWLSLDDADALSAASFVAMLLNVTQPLAFWLVSPRRRWVGAHLVYITLMAAEAPEYWDASIAPAEGCDHLDLSYWNTSRAAVYIATSLVLLYDIPDMFWKVINLVLFTLTLVAASVLYPCGAGSVWCWLVALNSAVLVGAHLLRDASS